MVNPDLSVDGLPSLTAIFSSVSSAWPDHDKFLRKSLGTHTSTELDTLERVAYDVLKLCGDQLPTYIQNYRWMCDVFRREAMYFFRTGSYRYSTFLEAARNVYDDRIFMKKYMDGLLLSQVLWANHAKCSINFIDSFLGNTQVKGRYLEIGPGHGLFLANAARSPRLDTIAAWDVSLESIDQTAAALKKLEINRPYRLEHRSLLDASVNELEFDVVVVSEVLEHLESPRDALLAVRRLLSKTGIVFINFPINSPAPDHIYLLESIEAVVQMLASCGLRAIDVTAIPMTGYTLEQALSNRITVNCLVTARESGASG
jgi:2-polyprenyl-3-methyl-5-hydroxy-6-metoxy-1,4-benzoquinol methylase